MNIQDKINFKTAEILIDLNCVNFSPKKQFKLTSGKKSPVYCDCRKLISFPNERNQLIDFGLKKIKQIKDFKSITNIAGGESAGIPFATMIANKLNLPMTYIRKEKKKFGKNSQIEGLIKRKDNILLVEDLMTDGGSKVKFIDAIENVGAKVNAIFVIFNYGINKNFFPHKKKKIELIFLTKWSYILNVALKKKILTTKDTIIIEKFLDSIGVKS